MDVPNFICKLTYEEVDLIPKNWYVGKPSYEIARVQLFTDRLIMPFGKFMDAVSDRLDINMLDISLVTQYDFIVEIFKSKYNLPTDSEIRAYLGLV